jgi:2-polyprenyl-3-methyl-5-hydroxy-6-metoxy-1,4-benzoquinol methylase
MKYFTHLRSEMSLFIPEQYSHVLEIGCAKGQFRLNLPKPCEYWGVELDPMAAKEASKVLDTVLNDSFEGIRDDLPNNYFDLIICNDIIEHIDDYVYFLETIKLKLSTTGKFIGSVPNVRYLKHLKELLISKDWLYRDKGILDRTHLRFFTQKSLQRTLKDTGFKINKFKGLHSVIKRKITFRTIKNLLQVTMLGKDTQYKQFGFEASKDI